MIWVKSKKKRAEEEQAKAQAEIRDRTAAKTERAKVVAELGKAEKKLEECVEKAAEAKRASNGMMYKQYASVVKVALRRKKMLERVLGQIDIVMAMGEMSASCKEINKSMSTIINGAGKFLYDPSAQREFENNVMKMNADMEMQQQYIEEWQMQIDAMMPEFSSETFDNFESDPLVDGLINAKYGSSGISNSAGSSKEFYDKDLQDTIDRLNKMNKQ